MFYCKLLLAFAFFSFTTIGFSQSKTQVAGMKQRLMTELKIDDVKADSAISAVMDFYKNARSLKGNADLKDDKRKTALQSNRKAMLSRLRANGFSTGQMQKLKQVMDEMKQERQHRKGAKDSTSA